MQAFGSFVIKNQINLMIKNVKTIQIIVDTNVKNIINLICKEWHRFEFLEGHGDGKGTNEE